MNLATRGLPVTHRRYIDRLVATHHLTIRSVHRCGPRFFVAAVDSPRGTALLKICLAAPLGSDFLRMKFRREVVFLQFAAQRPSSSLAKSVPRIYAAGTGAWVWYLREHVHGQGFDIRGGNVVFRKVFFTPAMLQRLGRLFSGLHAYGPAHVPAVLRPEKSRYDSVANLLHVLADNHRAYSRWLGKETLAALQEFLSGAQKTYDTSPTRLAHFEPYPVHFFLDKQRLKLIDWENIYWAAPVRDWVILWMRANGHAAWQKQLVATAKKDVGPILGRDFTLVWNVDRLMLSCLMLSANTRHVSQRGIVPLQRVARRCIQQAVQHPAALYEHPFLRS